MDGHEKVETKAPIKLVRLHELRRLRIETIGIDTLLVKLLVGIYQA